MAAGKKKAGVRPKARAIQREPDPDGLDYTGVHAFVFVDHVQRPEGDRGLSRAIDDLADVPQVRFAARMLGSFPLFAHLRTEDVPEMLELIDLELWEAGVRCQYATEKAYSVTVDGKKGAKRGSPGVIGLTRIWVEPAADPSVDEIDQLLQIELPRLGEVFRGASSVAGGFDILVQLGHPSSLDAVLEAAKSLRRLPFVARTETAITQLEA